MSGCAKTRLPFAAGGQDVSGEGLNYAGHQDGQDLLGQASQSVHCHSLCLWWAAIPVECLSKLRGPESSFTLHRLVPAKLSQPCLKPVLSLSLLSCAQVSIGLDLLFVRTLFWSVG